MWDDMAHSSKPDHLVNFQKASFMPLKMSRKRAENPATATDMHYCSATRAAGDPCWCEERL